VLGALGFASVDLGTCAPMSEQKEQKRRPTALGRLSLGVLAVSQGPGAWFLWVLFKFPREKSWQSLAERPSLGSLGLNSVGRLGFRFAWQQLRVLTA